MGQVTMDAPIDGPFEYVYILQVLGRTCGEKKSEISKISIGGNPNFKILNQNFLCNLLHASKNF
jgi:hypothetical protein